MTNRNRLFEFQDMKTWQLACLFFALLMIPTTARAQTAQEQQCFNAVQGKVAWNQAGNKTWSETNIRNLCKGTTNPGATIACFQDQIRSQDNWQRAISTCHSPQPPVAQAQASGTRYAASVLGLQCLQTSDNREVFLKYRIDGTGAGGTWSHYESATNGRKSPRPGEMWKRDTFYHRFNESFYIEVWKRSPDQIIGSLNITASDRDGRREAILEKGGDKYKLAVVKDTLPQPRTVRVYEGRYYPPKEFSFFGNVREPIPPVIPVGKQSLNSCVAWSITAALGTQMLNRNQILKSGTPGFDRKAFMRTGLNMLDAQWLYAQRADPTQDAGWNIETALNTAKRKVIPFVDNPKYGVRIVSWQRIDNDPDQVRWLLSKEIPLITAFNFTDELTNYDGKYVFLGSVDNNVKATMGHAVTLIGYNDPWAGREIGVPYFEVQNSWGKEWGRDGYFLFKPGSVKALWNGNPENMENHVYQITSAVISETATGRILSDNESNQVIEAMLKSVFRPKTDLDENNITTSRQFAEPADQIAVSVIQSSPATPKVGVRLTAGRITWWKGVKIYKNGSLVTELWTQDNRHDSGLYLMDVNATDKYEIEFLKAKTFGAHTGIKKHTIDLYQFRGKQITFTWNKD